jgi:hypothetical protein
MSYQLATLSADHVSLQAGVGLQDQSSDGQYVSISLAFLFAEGHYSKRQLLEKAKRLMEDALVFVRAEIAKSP